MWEAIYTAAAIYFAIRGTLQLRRSLVFDRSGNTKRAVFSCLLASIYLETAIFAVIVGVMVYIGVIPHPKL